MIEKIIGDNAFSISPRPEMRKFRTRRNIERSRGASGVRHGFSLSSRGSVETVILHPGYAVSGRHVGQAED